MIAFFARRGPVCGPHVFKTGIDFFMLSMSQVLCCYVLVLGNARLSYYMNQIKNNRK